MHINKAHTAIPITVLCCIILQPAAHTCAVHIVIILQHVVGISCLRTYAAVARCIFVEIGRPGGDVMWGRMLRVDDEVRSFEFPVRGTNYPAD